MNWARPWAPAGLTRFGVPAPARLDIDLGGELWRRHRRAELAGLDRGRAPRLASPLGWRRCSGSRRWPPRFLRRRERPAGDDDQGHDDAERPHRDRRSDDEHRVPRSLHARKRSGDEGRGGRNRAASGAAADRRAATVSFRGSDQIHCPARRVERPGSVDRLPADGQCPLRPGVGDVDPRALAAARTGLETVRSHPGRLGWAASVMLDRAARRDELDDATSVILSWARRPDPRPPGRRTDAGGATAYQPPLPGLGLAEA